jgi:bacterioferritin-associated ferredoxin
MKPKYVPGDSFKDSSDDYWTSGINAASSESSDGVWSNRIECYGKTEAEAVKLRDQLLGALLDAIDAHLAQPAQAVDVGAIREVIARVAADNQQSALTLGVEGLRGQCIETAKELHKLTRAIGNAQAEGREHEWSVGYDVTPYCRKCGDPMPSTTPATPNAHE